MEIVEILLLHLGGSVLGAWITYEVLSKKHRRELWKVQMKLLQAKRERDLETVNRIREEYSHEKSK
jgi:hypothetical protein